MALPVCRVGRSGTGLEAGLGDRRSILTPPAPSVPAGVRHVADVGRHFQMSTAPCRTAARPADPSQRDRRALLARPHCCMLTSVVQPRMTLTRSRRCSHRRSGCSTSCRCCTRSRGSQFIEGIVPEECEVTVAESAGRIVSFLAARGGHSHALYPSRPYRRGRGKPFDEARQDGRHARRWMLWCFQANRGTSLLRRSMAFVAVRFTDGTDNGRRRRSALPLAALGSRYPSRRVGNRRRRLGERIDQGDEAMHGRRRHRASSRARVSGNGMRQCLAEGEDIWLLSRWRGKRTGPCPAGRALRAVAGNRRRHVVQPCIVVGTS